MRELHTKHPPNTDNPEKPHPLDGLSVAMRRVTPDEIAAMRAKRKKRR